MASSAPNVPVSLIIASKASINNEPQKKTREDWRKAKELEEARKAGTAPAAVDEEGKDINPHIPQYIASAPWYYNTSGPTLKHQRPQHGDEEKKNAKVGEWFQRGVNLQSISTKFREGACGNCGALTHKKKDCFERPRKVGAKYTGINIAPDEFIQPNLQLDFDGKRDRWNGYDPAEHSVIIEEFQKVEEAKRQLKAQRLNTGDDDADEEEADEDEDKYVDEVDMPGTKVDSKQRITVRNLRIREDTAKYLRNLDPNSAYYDPKTRSMRDNPYKNTGKNPDEVDYGGENFVRYTGDTAKHAQAQLFAWEAQTAGVDVHLLSEPTKAEKLQLEHSSKKDEIKNSVQESILQRYGGKEHLQVPPKALLLAQSESYVEYSRTGKIIKGAEKPIVRSRYEEDVFINNHTTVWGSFWKDGEWGYQCCHSLIKNSYCTGESGKASSSNTNLLSLPPTTSKSKTDNDSSNDSDDDDEDDSDDDGEEKKVKEKKKTPEEIEEEETKREQKEQADKRRKKKRDRKKKKQMKKKEKKKRHRRRSTSSSSSDDSSDDETAAKKRKLEEALRMEESRIRQADRMLKIDERQRPYNSMVEVKAPTEEEMQAYFMKRKRDEDPMAAFM